jgi:hypothetical protein
MSSESRYFVYGRFYIPPAIYVRVDDQGRSFVVDPASKEMPSDAPLGRWLERVASGWMAEATKGGITAAMEDWNRENTQKLKLP